MTRFNRLVGVVGLATALAASAVSAASVSLSMNLTFNSPNDFSSGGSWRIVGKADERGIRALSVNLFNINAGSIAFLAPQFETQQLTFIDDVDDYYAFSVSDNQSAKSLDLGVIGGSVPSSYVDAPGTLIYPGYADLGSFTGGIELASGTFDPGIVPYWVAGPTAGSNSALVYVAPDGDTSTGVFVARTMRYAIPEPATFGLAGLALLGVATVARRSRA